MHRAGRFALFAVLMAATAVAYRGLIPLANSSTAPRGVNSTEAFLFEPASSSPWLIFACTVWLLAARIPRLREFLGKPSMAVVGSFLSLTAAMLGVWSYYVDEPTLLVTSLSIGILGVGALFGGPLGLRLLALPAGFLLLAIPVPAAIVNQIAYPAQLWTAEASATILGGIGLPATYHADLVFYDGRIFQVIESCSGIRSVVTLTMAAVLYQELFFRSRLQSFLLILLAPLAAVVVNTIRVITIILNPLAEIASVHTLQGLLMIAIGVLFLALIDAGLSRFIHPKPVSPVRPPSPLAISKLFFVTGIVCAFSVATWTIVPWTFSGVYRPELSKISLTIEGLRATSLRINPDYLGTTGYSEWVHRKYGEGRDSVDIVVLGNTRLDPRINTLSPKTAIPGRGWDVQSRQDITFGDGTPGQVLTVISPRGREQLVYHWRTGFLPTWLETVRSILGLDRSPYRRPGRSVTIRIATPIGTTLFSRQEASHRLEQFGAAVRSQLASLDGEKS